VSGERSPVLAVRGVSKSFGGVQALSDVTFEIDSPGDIVGLVGPNGAGKTTLFNCIAGQEIPDEGTVVLAGRDVTRLSPYKTAAAGVSRTFQDTRLFDELTVEENLVQACQPRRRGNVLTTFLRSGARRPVAAAERVEKVLETTGLWDRREDPVRMLSYAERSLLGIGMAFAAEPAVALMDEPFGGLNDAEIETTMEVVRKVAADGIAVLLVEHVMRAVMGLSQRIEVLNFGAQIASGTPEEVGADPTVIEAYLGTGAL
jgi:branched-chain amino acid transport system ATP-binding protein